MEKGQITIFVLMGIFLVAAIFVLVFLNKGELKIEDELVCGTDEDCIKVQTTCCDCTMGGEEKCVSRDEKEFYKEQMDNCPSGLNCIAVFNCEISSCKCVNGRCEEIL